MKHPIIFMILSIALSSCVVTNNTGDTGKHYNDISQGMPSEPGKCYAKCLIQDEYKVEKVKFYEYTGPNPSTTEGVDYGDIVIKEASSTWEKKKKEGKCLSADPNDCLVWYLVEEPEKKVGLYIVIDTTKVRSFKTKSINRRVIVKEGGFTEWKEIVCAADVTPKLYKRLQQALIDRNFDVGSAGANGKVGPATKNALVQFQKMNGLSVGALDIVTLKALGVKY